MDIFDLHLHVGNFALLRDDIQDLLKKKPFEQGESMPALFTNPTELEPYLRRNGVVRGVVIAECGPGTNFTIDSELVTKFASKHPFFIPFGNINPHHHVVEDELLRSLEMGVRGFKFYPADHNFDPALDEMLFVYEQCEKHHLPIMFHTGLTAQRDAKEKYIEPNVFRFIAERYPTLNIILAHAGKPHWYADAHQMMIEYPNVFVDTALVSRQDLEHLCNDYSDISDKILFGSDWPVCGSYSRLINDYLSANIAKPMLEKIMYGNANKLLGHVVAGSKEHEHVS